MAEMVLDTSDRLIADNSQRTRRLAVLVLQYLVSERCELSTTEP